jgi:hypothetical protein
MGMENCNFWEVFSMGFFFGAVSAIFLIVIGQAIIQEFKSPRIKYHRMFKR